jgi:hypothetical protein
LVWKAISSMTPMIWATWRDEASMPPIASTVDSTTSREWPASVWASRTAWCAALAPSAVLRTVAVIWSRAAAASSRLAACCSERCDRSSAAVGDAAGPGVQARHRRDHRAHRRLEPFDGLVEVGAQALIVLREGVGEAHGQVAGRQPAQAVGQAGHDLRLGGGQLAVARGGLAALGLAGLALGLNLGLDAALFPSVVAEGVDGVGHQADIVAAAGEGQGHIEIAAHHPLHGVAQVAQRPQLARAPSAPRR